MSKFYRLLLSWLSTAIALTMVTFTFTAVEGSELEAVSAYKKGDYTTAARLWRQEAETATRAQNKIVALSNLASTYLKLDRVDNALRIIEQNLDLIGTTGEINSSIYAQALLVAGNVSEAQGNTKIAVERWSKARDMYRGRDLTGLVKASLNLIKGYSDLGLYNRLDEELARLETITDDLNELELIVQSLLAMGNAYQLIGNYDLAELRIEQAVELNPNAETIMALANLYKYQGKYDRAEAQLTNLLAQRRSSSEYSIIYRARLQQMQLAMHQKQWSKALELARVLQIESARLPVNNTTLRWQLKLVDNWLRIAEKNAGNVELDLVENYLAQLKEKSLELGSTTNRAQVDYQLARLHYLQQDYQNAIEVARRSIAADPLVENYQVFWVITQAHQALGNFSEAIKTNQTTIDLINQIKGDLVSNPEFQFQFQNEVRPIYDNLVALLIDRPGDSEPSQEDLLIARDTIESLQLVELENYFRVACLETNERQIDTIDNTASAIYPIFLEERVVTIVSLGDFC